MVDVGNWIKPSNGKIISIKYLQITPKNMEFYQGSNGNGSVKKDFVLVEEDEIKKAEEYLEKLLNLKIGDYIKGKKGFIHPWVDKISKIPKMKNPFDIQDYIYDTINTKKGNWIWYLDAPYAIPSEEEIKNFYE